MSPGKDVSSGYDVYYMGTKFSRFEPRALASPFPRFNTDSLYDSLSAHLWFLPPLLSLVPCIPLGG